MNDSQGLCHAVNCPRLSEMLSIRVRGFMYRKALPTDSRSPGPAKRRDSAGQVLRKSPLAKTLRDGALVP
jgi:hypothetical protein